MNRVRSPKHSFRLVFKEKYGAGKLHYSVFPDSPVKKFDTWCCVPTTTIHGFTGIPPHASEPSAPATPG
jgi:hypothetical protein